MKKKVLTFGTFDYFHKGHRFYLEEAGKLGDELFVLVACDQAVLKIKKRKPDKSESVRLEEVKKLSFISQAFIGKPIKSREDYLNPIRQIRPQVVALGYDQALKEEEWLKEAIKDFDSGIEVVRIKSFKPEKYKSSIVKLQAQLKEQP